jgi:hypothetical protein
MRDLIVSARGSAMLDRAIEVRSSTSNLDVSLVETETKSVEGDSCY